MQFNEAEEDQGKGNTAAMMGRRALYANSTNPFLYSEPKVQALLPKAFLDLAEGGEAVETIKDGPGLGGDGDEAVTTDEYVAKLLVNH